MKTLNQQSLKELFYYKEGYLYWNICKQGVTKGSKAGSGQHRRYLQVMVNRKSYLIHRLIAIFHYGDFDGIIDHVDGNTYNNKIENLRIVTHKENAWNAKKSIRNKTNVKGVSFIKDRQKYQATICIDGKNKNLGQFSSLEEAKEVVNKARSQLHGEYARYD